ncbi:MAG: hypothetical protein ACXVFN_12985 [Solirubrobacteraceae bacterium]
MPAKRWIVGVVVVVVGLAVVLLATRPGGSSDSAAASDTEPARVEPIKGTDLSRVTLAPQAARRLGVRTAPVTRLGHREVIPYAAVLYAPDGRTFTYTSPAPLVFVRRFIGVDRIAGSRALLSNGPPVGTSVVTVGSQELFGVEYHVEEG